MLCTPKYGSSFDQSQHRRSSGDTASTILCSDSCSERTSVLDAALDAAAGCALMTLLGGEVALNASMHLQDTRPSWPASARSLNCSGGAPRSPTDLMVSTSSAPPPFLLVSPESFSPRSPGASMGGLCTKMATLQPAVSVPAPRSSASHGPQGNAAAMRTEMAALRAQLEDAERRELESRLRADGLQIAAAQLASQLQASRNEASLLTVRLQRMKGYQAHPHQQHSAGGHYGGGGHHSAHHHHHASSPHVHVHSPHHHSQQQQQDQQQPDQQQRVAASAPSAADACTAASLLADERAAERVARDARVRQLERANLCLTYELGAAKARLQELEERQEGPYFLHMA